MGHFHGGWSVQTAPLPHACLPWAHLSLRAQQNQAVQQHMELPGTKKQPPLLLLLRVMALSPGLAPAMVSSDWNHSCHACNAHMATKQSDWLPVRQFSLVIRL